MSINIIVNGAEGRMGQLAVKAIANQPEFNLVSQTGRKNNLAQEIKNTQAKIVVDLTNADSVWENTSTIIEAGAHPVIGTSGLLTDQIQQLQQQCSKLKLGGIIAPNFSIGAILIMKYAADIVKYFPEVEIIEMHHAGKLDSPSGTALRTAELMSHTRQQKPSQKKLKEIIPGARGANHHDIPIHAIRLPGIVAQLQVIFGGTGETLTLCHDTIDRQCFMPGVILACKKVLELKELIIGLEKII